MAEEDTVFYAAWLLTHEAAFQHTHRNVDPRVFPRGPLRYLVDLALRRRQSLSGAFVAVSIDADKANLRRAGVDNARLVTQAYADLQAFRADDPGTAETAAAWLQRRALLVGVEAAGEILRRGDTSAAVAVLGRASYRLETTSEPALLSARAEGILAADNKPAGSPTGTGLYSLDEAWRGGIRPGELGLVMAPTGIGKSMILCAFSAEAFWQARHILYYCVDPETAILRSDLSWTPAGDLLVGDGLLGFDDLPTRQFGRSFRTGTVTANSLRKLPCYDIRLVDGTLLRSTAEHRWIVQGKYRDHSWTETRKLRPGYVLRRLVKRHNPERSFEAGFLSAAFDGEGSFGWTGLTLAFAQKPNAFQAAVLAGLLDYDFAVYQGNLSRAGVQQLIIRGGMHEALRFLSQMRPPRLSQRFADGLNQHYLRVQRTEKVPIADVRFVGEQWVSALSSSTGTYIAEGFGAHNTSELTEDQILTRILLGILGMSYSDIPKGLSWEELLVRVAKTDRRTLPAAAEIEVREAGTMNMQDLKRDMQVFIDQHGQPPGLLVLDSADDIAMTGRFEKGYEMFRAQYTMLRTEFAQQFKVPIWCAVQANREAVDKARLSLKNLADAYAKAQRAHYVLGVAQTREQQNDPDGPLVSMYVLKDSLHGSRSAWMICQAEFGAGYDGYAGLKEAEAMGFHGRIEL